MTLLRIFNDGNKNEAQFLDLSEMKDNAFDEKYYKSIELIEIGDVVDLISYIINHKDALMDEYKDDVIGNPAQNLIYKELYSGLSEVINSKDNLVSTIDNEYKELSKKYDV